MALGVYSVTGGGTGAAIVTLTGTTWSAAAAPLPTNTASGTTEDAPFNAVACPTAGNCVAAGSFRDKGGAYEAVVDTSTGGTWTSKESPLPTGALSTSKQDAELLSVSCPASGSCVATGTYVDATDRSSALIEEESDSTWTPVSPSLPAGAASGSKETSTLGSVSCAAVGACTAVGDYTDTASHRHGLIETLKTGVWASTDAAEPTGAGVTTRQDAYLNHVSCPATGTCVAVGNYEAADDSQFGEIETKTSGLWGAATQAPQPEHAQTGATAANGLDSVSCPKAGSCTAVGEYFDTATDYAPLIETLSAGSWAATGPGEPPNATTSGATKPSELQFVSCNSGGCAAGGYFSTTAGGQQALLATLVEPSSTTPGGSTPPSMGSTGYDLVGSDGGVFVFDAPGQTGGFFGSLPGLHVIPAAPIVGLVPTLSDQGYFLVGNDGGVFAFGTAPFLGSLPGKHVTPSAPIVGIVAADTDKGYFLVGRDGGVFAFGTVPFLGSLPGKGISVDNIIGIAATPSGDGYWLVQATGKVYGFGAAKALGTLTGSSSPVSAIAGTPTGGGYWITTENGTVKAFGNAKSFGTLPALSVTPALPVIGIVHTSGTGGYWLIGSDGGIFAFGNAGFVGSLPGVGVHVTNILGAVPN
jgi:hypothetical protein